MLVPALRTVGNIVTGDDLQTQVIINCGALGCLLHLLTTSQKKSIKKVWSVPHRHHLQDPALAAAASASYNLHCRD